MLLAPLTETMGLVRDRIQEFEREFSNNELQTRLSLVDPVLKALGWDPQNPSVVRVEFPVRQRNRNTKADYALLDSMQAPIAFVEAKSLKTDLGTAQDQLFEYAVGKSVPYAIATNGADWTIFKKENKETGVSIDVLLKVSIPDQSSTLAAIKLLSLWRGLLTSQSSIDRIAPALNTLATHPFKPETVRTLNIKTATSGNKERTELERGTREQPLQVNEDTSSDKTFALSNPPDITGRSPARLVLADGTTVRINTWSSLLKEIVQWLLTTTRLNVDIPWRENPNSKRNILQATPIHNRKGAIIKQQTEIVPGLFLLTNHNAQGNCQIAAKLLDDCRIPSSQVTVTLAPLEL